MRITNFEHTGLDRVQNWISRNDIELLDERTLKESLKTVNIFFVAEGINRVQSMLLCEIKASYVQQSQRYVNMQVDEYSLPELDKLDKELAVHLIKRAFDLYKRMSELKEGKFKGRPKIDNYVHGIPIEDSRYILPLSVTTNICVSMTGDKLVDLFMLLNDIKYGSIFDEFKNELKKNLPVTLINLLPTPLDDSINNKLLDELYKDDFEQINSDNNLVLLSHYTSLDSQVALGALTSTQSNTASQLLEIWGEKALEKAAEVTERVLGYGHDSIAEQARTTFGMMCSLVTYHQQVRHRLPETRREDMLILINDKKRPVIIPGTIQKSKFLEEYLGLTNEFKEFRDYIYAKCGQDTAYFFLLNCDQIKLILSTNARMDVKTLAERTCMNAQWEIRDLAIKRLKILRSLSNVLYEQALPSCITSKCKEGKLTCGKQHELVELLGSTMSRGKIDRLKKV